MGAYIHVFIQPMNWPSRHDMEVKLPLDRALIERGYQTLDLPSPGADGIDRMICSSSAKIVEVTKSRAIIADVLSKALTKAILEIMGANDTEMGYPKK